MATAVSPSTVQLVEGIVARVARSSGHIGDVTVSNVRANRRGYSARVVLSRCGGKYARTYRATVPTTGSVKLTAVDAARVTR